MTRASLCVPLSLKGIAVLWIKSLLLKVWISPCWLRVLSNLVPLRKWDLLSGMFPWCPAVLGNILMSLLRKLWIETLFLKLCFFWPLYQLRGWVNFLAYRPKCTIQRVGVLSPFHLYQTLLPRPNYAKLCCQDPESLCADFIDYN